MADNELKIIITADKTAAIAERQAFNAESKRLDKELLSDAEVLEKAKAEFIKRQNAQRIQEAAAANKTEIELAREKQAEEEKVAKELAESEKRAAKEADAAKRKSERDALAEKRAAAKEAEKLARETASAEATEARKTEAEKRRIARQQANAEKQAAREMEQALRERAKAEEKAARDLAAQKERWAKEESERTNDQVEQSEKQAEGIKRVAAGYLGLQTAIRAARFLADAWRDTAEKTERAAKAALDFERASRVSGTLKGISAEQMAPQVATLMAQTGLDQNEADNLIRQFEGSLPAGLQKGNISRGTADQLLVQAAMAQARQGGDAGTRGDLFGVLSQYQKIGSVEEGMGQAEAIRMALTEGRGDDTPLTNSLLHVSGSLVREGGPMGTLPELAALVGVTSLSAGPTMADTRALQVSRAVRGTTTKQMEAISKQFGIPVGSKMGLEERLGKVIPKLQEIGKTQDIQSWLTNTVDTPEENAQALVEVMSNWDVLQHRFAAARKASGQGSQAMEANQNFQGTAVGKDMAAGSLKDVGTYVAGSKYKDAEALIAESRAVRAAEPQTLARSMNDKISGWFGADPATSRVFYDLKALAAEKGVGLNVNEETPVANIQGMINQLREHGVDPMNLNQADITEKIREPLEAMSKAAENMNAAAEKISRAADRGAMNGKPTPPSAGIGEGTW